jgi:2,3-dihydroxybiphenyl 1,2-dioxygenase
MTTGRVQQLGYLGLDVTDVAAWENMATNVLAMEVSGKAADGSLYLRMDAFHHRFILHESDHDGLAYVGWEVQDAAALDAVCNQLAAIGVPTTEVTDEEKEVRGVLGLRRFPDQDGVPNELFYGPLLTDEYMVPWSLRGRYVTGPLGLGHITSQISDLDEHLRIYVDGLGFRISGRRDAELGPGVVARVAPLRCNRRHHSINCVELPAPPKLLHIGLQFADIDEVGIAMDKAKERGLVEIPLGRHQGDHMLSFYMRTPSGFQIEVGWGGRELDDDFRVEQYDGAYASIWGHEGIQ